MYGLGSHEWRDVFGHLGTPDECGNEWIALQERLDEMTINANQCSGLLGDALRYIEALEEKLSSIQAERNSLLEELASVKIAVQEEIKNDLLSG